MDHYRSSFEYREILRILQKSSALMENILWQSHAMGKTVIPIHHFEIDFVSREVVIFFDSQRHKLERELPLYIKLDYRTSVFKVTEYKEAKNSIHFAFPKEIKTLELRSFPRHVFSHDQEKAISLRSSLSGNRELGSELQVRALDISQYGLGVLVSEHNRQFLKNNRILWVTQIGSWKLEHPILSEVVYINTEVDSKFLVRKQKEMKVGLKLSGVMPTHVFNNFVQ